MSDHVKNCRVLVVDDDPIVRSTVVAIFAKFGYPVAMAGDGHDAAGRIQHTDYALVMSDFDMPDINGYQLACRIKLKNSHTKVVIMTGRGLSLAFEYAGCREVDAWLFKPFDLEAINNVMEALQLPNAFTPERPEGGKKAA